MGYCEQDLASLLENMPTPFSEAQVRGGGGERLHGPSFSTFAPNRARPDRPALRAGQVHRAAGAPGPPVPAPELHHPQVGGSRGISAGSWHGGRVTGRTDSGSQCVTAPCQESSRGRHSLGAGGSHCSCGNPGPDSACLLVGAGAECSRGSEKSCSGGPAWGLRRSRRG